MITALEFTITRQQLNTMLSDRLGFDVDGMKICVEVDEEDGEFLCLHVETKVDLATANKIERKLKKLESKDV